MAKTRDERLEVIEALSVLQKVHSAIVEKYAIDTGARLGELVDIVRGRVVPESKSQSISRSKAKVMLDQINEVKLKPEKGRGKDLYRIEKLLSELEETYRSL